MITLHHLNNSRSQRILWLLEELQVDYEIRFYQRDTKTDLAPPELKKIHPLGKAPIITDGDLTFAESGAILEYLAERYGAGQWIPAAGSQAFYDYRYWLHAAEGSLMPLLVMKLIFNKITSSPMPFFVKPIARAIANNVDAAYMGPNLKSQLGAIEQHLSQNKWFAGEQISAADIQMSFPLEAALNRQAVATQHKQIQQWLERIHARPAYQRALSKGGDYAYA